MTRRWLGWVLVCINLTVCSVSCRGQAIELARDYYKHGVAEKAKEILIAAIHDRNVSAASKAEALYVLGQISFEQNRYSVAFDDWEQLIKAYPQTPQAKEISDRLTQLREVISKSAENQLSSAVASSYLHNGDFWSHSSQIFTIDSSWLPDVEMSIFWYDKLIKEFPAEAEVGYRRKMFSLLGWRNDGSDRGGVKADFVKYMPQLVDTFAKFEKDFPNSSSLQPFRFQIAQAYWLAEAGTRTEAKAGYEREARLWFAKIIEASHGVETFYTRCAKDRLQNFDSIKNRP